jgi:hypothetical protein
MAIAFRLLHFYPTQLSEHYAPDTKHPGVFLF